jgi:hypothetical protein
MFKMSRVLNSVWRFASFMCIDGLAALGAVKLASKIQDRDL